MKLKNGTYEHIKVEFSRLLGLLVWEPPKAYESAFVELLDNVNIDAKRFENLQEAAIDACCDKLEVYRSLVHDIVDYCAKYKIYFNYMQKVYLSANISDKNTIRCFLIKNGISPNICQRLMNYTIEDIDSIKSRIADLVSNDSKHQDVIDSIFAKFLYSLFDKIEIEKYNSHQDKYNPDYFKFLRIAYPEKYDRNNALSVLHINESLYHRFNNYVDFIGFVFAFIRKQYEELNNYCYLSVIIDDLGKDSNESLQWRMYSDIVLFAEKHVEENLSIGYFHPQKIKEQTREYISELELDVDFNIAYDGFTYKDCYIVTKSSFNKGENMTAYSMVLLFQKNHRDEDVIPCPACRSINVRGNSYPVVGVKSWECKNPLCPDKSKYNRGKRYSFSSILKQESISSVENEIDKSLIGEWRLDVVQGKSINDILEMIIKEYSFVGDIIKLYSDKRIETLSYKRNITRLEIPALYEDPNRFWNNGYFKRFVIKTNKVGYFRYIQLKKGIDIYLGNCRDVLLSLPENSISGAVTSPPYYNAKEYSQWGNIYCYLYDMYNHARAVYHVLKPGAYYLYNIFDYFDNENNLVFSDMGKKRMILGAYIIYMFREIGFEIIENTIWYKGHIQGNRSNNQGNNSPYYQAPLNCYEHIFVFRKPSKEALEIQFPKILSVGPVIKIVKGKNVLGHTAPFPSAIPQILLTRISEGPVLDPYAGSFTTSRAAYRNKISSLSIELSPAYYNLGKKLLEEEFRNNIGTPSLFDYF